MLFVDFFKKKFIKENDEFILNSYQKINNFFDNL